MTPEQAQQRLDEMLEITNAGEGNLEKLHIEADEILCDLLASLGHSRITETFRKIEKWYA